MQTRTLMSATARQSICCQECRAVEILTSRRANCCPGPARNGGPVSADWPQNKNRLCPVPKYSQLVVTWLYDYDPQHLTLHCLHCLLREELILLVYFIKVFEARGSIVGWGIMPQAGRSRVRLPMRSLNFSINLIFSAALGSGIDSPSKINDYQRSSGSKTWPAHNSDNLPVICEPIVYNRVGQPNTSRGPNLIYRIPSGARESVSFRRVVSFQDMNTVWTVQLGKNVYSQLQNAVS
jgi:hypothetical protein